MSAKRTERLLTLVILLLSSRRGFTKEELFEEIELYGEASTDAAREKLFDRDKAMLREQGIPLEAFSEDPLFDNDNTVQRYRINAEDYRLAGVNFSPEEYAALSLAASLWDQGSLDSAASRAVRKLSTRRGSADVLSRLPVQPRIPTSDPHWDEVWRAMSKRKLLRFTYRAASTGCEEERTLEPWGMGARFGHWYVVGYDTARRAERFFRLSRITSAPRILDAGFVVPDSFDMNRALASLRRSEPDHTARIAVRPGSCNALRVRKGSTVVSAGEEWDQLEVRYSSAQALAPEIAVFGPNARVARPAELAAEVDTLLRGALEALRSAPTEVPLSSAPVPFPRRQSSAQDHLLRLLDLVPYLLSHPGAGLAPTARRFDVTTDQLTRDLDLLFVSGPRHYPDGLIDVNVEDGRIYLTNAQNLAEPVKLSMDEACALIVGLQSLRNLTGMRSTEALVSASAKLAAAAGDAARVGSSVATKLTEEDIDPALEALQAALAAGVRVEMSYLVPARDEISQRLLEPVRVFSHQDVWYLEAWCVHSEGLRNFRLDRIQDVRPIQAPAEHRHPAPAAGSAASRSIPEVYRPSPHDTLVTLVLQPPARWLADQYGAVRRGELPDGALAAEVRLGSVSWLPGLVARMGGSAVVIQPREVRASALRWVEDALAVRT
ncbi:WYL domain-containing protein [Arthrobacter sp. Br18]|uniref:helix-turn-helix transcriptional regulator n=1 Tax=Arthrobacter sp. Br18 TaxID=1312954 RepID=UPI0004B92AC5|nr:WYL domain-containing protein [Arthrobacter sp. Br18]